MTSPSRNHHPDDSYGTCDPGFTMLTKGKGRMGFPIRTLSVAKNRETCPGRTVVGALLGGHGAVPRGTAGRRPMLVVPHAGLVVALEGDGDKFSSAPDAGLLKDVA